MLAQVCLPILLSCLFWKGERLGIKALCLNPSKQRIWVVAVWLLCWATTSEVFFLWPLDSVGSLAWLFCGLLILHRVVEKVRFKGLIKFVALGVFLTLTLPSMSFDLNTVLVLCLALALITIHEQGQLRLQDRLGALGLPLMLASALSISVVMFAHANTSAPSAFLAWVIPMSVHHSLSSDRESGRAFGGILFQLSALMLLNAQQAYVAAPEEPLFKTLGLYFGVLLVMVAPLISAHCSCSRKKRTLLYVFMLSCALASALLAYGYEGSVDHHRSPYEDMY